MMRNSGAFGERGLCGANIEAAVELGGVTSDDFAAEFSSQKNSQRGFAGSGRPDDGEQRWNISDTHHRKKMCQPRMMRMARTITARSRLPRTDRKSTRLNSSHLVSSYAVFCLKTN